MNPNEIYQPLRWTYGLIPLLAGLDKFSNLLADWPSYVSPAMEAVLPVTPATLMYGVGMIEIAVGLMILTRWVREGAWLACGWLVLIAGNLALAGYLDVAVRDLAMAVGAYTLARLAAARQEVPATASAIA